MTSRDPASIAIASAPITPWAGLLRQVAGGVPRHGAMPRFTCVNANAHAVAHCAAFCGGQRALNRRASLNGGEHREVHRCNARIEHRMIAARPARYWNLSTVSELNAAPDDTRRQ